MIVVKKRDSDAIVEEKIEPLMSVIDGLTKIEIVALFERANDLIDHYLPVKVEFERPSE